MSELVQLPWRPAVLRGGGLSELYSEAEAEI